MKPELTATPRLAPGVRLNEKSQLPRTLLMPERALRLNGPSLEIVQLCDGHHSVQQIAEKLHALYFAYVNPGWPPPGAFQPAKESAE